MQKELIIGLVGVSFPFLETTVAKRESRVEDFKFR